MINLSPQQERVFRYAFRVLKQGGRLANSDVVATAKMPDDVEKDMAMYIGCITGASNIPELESMLEQVGFDNIRINPKDQSKAFIRDWSPGIKVEDYVV